MLLQDRENLEEKIRQAQEEYRQLKKRLEAAEERKE